MSGSASEHACQRLRRQSFDPEIVHPLGEKFVCAVVEVELPFAIVLPSEVEELPGRGGLTQVIFKYTLVKPLVKPASPYGSVPGGALRI